MAELGPGPTWSGDIADELNRRLPSWADQKPTNRQRNGLESTHGDTAFTVPLFDEFMHRVMRRRLEDVDNAKMEF